MTHNKYWSHRILLFLLFATRLAPANISYSAYPGVIELSVDATDVDHRIFSVAERIPVSEGPITLWLPKWIPGQHSPQGAVNMLAGLVVTGNGKRIEWQRDPLDMFAFNLQVPKGVKILELSFQSVTPVDPQQRVVMTSTMLDLQWKMVGLYPSGFDPQNINFTVSVKVPKGWKAFSALDLESQSHNTYRYKTVDFDTLIDSPVYAGKYYTTFDLDPGAKVPVRLNVLADDPRYLVAKPEHIEAHRNLIKQAKILFSSHHYDHYDFLFWLSKQMSPNGLEHHRSSEDGSGTDYFVEWNPKVGNDLLPHEYSHSWNGKFRRPQGLATPNFNVPMQDGLLWVYEGQTQYWGDVLAARSGLRSAEAARDQLALTIAAFTENKQGLSWRALLDTTNDPIFAYHERKPYGSWQLGSEYYSGGELIWLAVDTQLRTKSKGSKSLDDFARAFFGVDDGSFGVKTYSFDDVVNTLNEVIPDDWATFLRDKIDGHSPLSEGLSATGWRLVFKDTPSAASKTAEKEGLLDYTYSLGFMLNKDAKFIDVRWDGPAFRAGIGTGMTLIAVGDRQYTKDYLQDAIKAAQKDKRSIKLIIKSFDAYRTVLIDYKGGLRYPHLERIEGTPDYLTAIYSPRI